MRTTLLPYPWKIAGYLLALTGTALTGCYLTFDFVWQVPVFAIYSGFLETKSFAIVQTNLSDELILLAFLAGFFLLVFSRERNEKKCFRLLRYKAAIRAAVLNTFVLLFSVLFLYGTGFIVVLAVNLYSTALIYLLVFRILRVRAARST